jgi:hypothetical protein
MSQEREQQGSAQSPGVMLNEERDPQIENPLAGWEAVLSKSSAKSNIEKKRPINIRGTACIQRRYAQRCLYLTEAQVIAGA